MDNQTSLLGLLACFAVLIVFLVAVIIFLFLRYYRKPGAASGSPKPAGAADLTEGMEEVGRILHHPLADRTVIFIGDRLISSPADLNGDQEKHLRLLHADLQKWFSPYSEPSAPEGAVPTLASVEKNTADLIVETPAIQKPNLVTGLAKTLRADVKEPVVVKSIAQQVNDVLQEQIANTPLHGRGIRMTDDPGGGLLIWVGLEKYPGIDELPDPEIQAAIRTAVDEWRRRTK